MESGERQIIGICVADTEKMFGMIKSSLLLLLNIVNINNIYICIGMIGVPLELCGFCQIPRLKLTEKQSVNRVNN